MKQILLFSLVFFSALCVADSKDEADKFRNVKYMIHEGTLLSDFDYVDQKTLKTFEDYDFTVESSPCTVLGDYYSSTDDNNTIYTVKIGDKDFKFMCRSVVGMQENERRLYMLGSVYDCLNRSFDYSRSNIEDYKYFGSMCKDENRQVYQKKVDFSYLELFYPEKYYKVLAANIN